MSRSWSSGTSLIAAAAICWGVFLATSAKANTIIIDPENVSGVHQGNVTVTFSGNVIGLVSGPAVSSTTATGFNFPTGAACGGGNAAAAACVLSNLATGTFTAVGNNVNFANIPGIDATDDPEVNTFQISSQFFALKADHWIAYFRNLTGGSITVGYDAINEGCTASQCNGAGLSHIVNLTSPTPGVFSAPVPGPLVGAGLPGLIAGCFTLLGLARWRRRQEVA